MIEKHAWSGVTHYDFYFLFHVWAVAVDEAFAAGAFFLLKRTFVKPQKSIFFEFFAFLAYFAVGSMVFSAVEVNHIPYGILFTSYPFVLRLRRLRFNTNPSLQTKYLTDPT